MAAEFMPVGYSNGDGDGYSDGKGFGDGHGNGTVSNCRSVRKAMPTEEVK